MKHGNVEFFSESFLNLETAWRRDVFEVDPTKHGRDCFHCAHDLVGIFCVETDRKCIDAGEFLEQHRLPFPHPPCRRWSNISETENRSSVCHNRDCIFLDRECEDFFRLLVNRVADASHTCCVRDGKIGASLQRHFGNDFDLAAQVHQKSRIRNLKQFDTVDV